MRPAVAPPHPRLYRARGPRFTFRGADLLQRKPRT